MEDIKQAVEQAEYFAVSLFRGVGAFDKGACDSLPAARDMARRMEAEAKGSRLSLVYAVRGTRSVLVPRDFVL